MCIYFNRNKNSRLCCQCCCCFSLVSRGHIHSKIKHCLADRFITNLNFIHHLLKIGIFGEIISVISVHVKCGCDQLLFHRKVHLNRSSLRDNHKGFPIVMLNYSTVLWDLFEVSLHQEIFPRKPSWRPYLSCTLRLGDL